MSKETTKDVQDLISEFVNSKDQNLHEAIIAKIKRESFGIIDDDDDKNNPPIIEESISINEQTKQSEMKMNRDRVTDLEKQIEDLIQQNSRLKHSISESNQSIESQPLDGGKPIGTDDLRIEFLNFTSAHIQQFNTRIKKTEELIEQLAQKNQTQPIKNNNQSYPKWLIWLNLISLGLIALYFLISLFKSNNQSGINSSPNVSIQKMQEQTPASASTIIPPQNTTTNNQTPSKKNEPITTSNLPFQNTASPNLKTTETTPNHTNKIVSEKQNNKIQNTPLATTTPSTKVAKNQLNKNANKNFQNSNSIVSNSQNPQSSTQTSSRFDEKKPVQNIRKTSMENSKQQPEKKATPKEKVYFGED